LEPQLAPAVLETMRTQLARVAEIRRAWIARKRTKHLPENPVYVLTFEAKGWRPNEPKLLEAISRVLDTPGLTFFVRKNADAGATAEKVIRRGVALLA
jgi:hypothetical protein